MKADNIRQLDRVFEEYSLMMDTVPIQIWFLSDIETYGRVNQYHADFLGMDKKDMEFKKLTEFVHKDIAEACKNSNRAVFETRDTVISEELIYNAAGEQRLISITKTPKFNKIGQIDYIVCFGIDITEHRAAETMLTQSEENFRTFIETIDDIVIIGNTDGRVIYTNPATSIKLGYSSEELGRKQIIDLHPEWARGEATRILSEMFTGKRTTCPLPLAKKNGSIIPVETRVWFGRWNNQRCIFGLAKDLSTEQEALQKFDKLFRINPALMALSKMPEETFTDVNDAFLNTLGFSMDEVIGKTSSDLHLFVNPEKQQRISRMLFENGHINGVELQVKTKDSRIREGLFSGDIIESQGAKYFLTVMIDITDRKNAEAEREATIQELQKALMEIKTLRGIVPICSNCKKIRDDRGYWEQVEEYISRHTEARFSHGICPECMQKLYPDFYKDEKDSNK